ncbi:MAG TPA: TetR/AcrR family transcriptional regulator [Sphingomonadaceae bacterium]|nr:TetR/AcrR family transcriptional regulator [Sphingomonadaceae bacterium]
MTVDAILEATAHILAQRGYDGTTTNHVAERAGVSIGSLYQYFPSKESLVAALLQRNAEDNLRTLRESIEQAEGMTLAGALRTIVDRFVAMHAQAPAHHAALLDRAPQIGIVEWERQSTDGVLQVLGDFLSRYRSELRDGLDLEMALPVLAAMGNAVLDHALRNNPGRLKDEDIRHEMVVAILAYLTGRISPPTEDDRAEDSRATSPKK